MIQIPGQVPIEKATTSPSGASSRGSHRLASAGGGCELMYALAYEHGLRPKSEPPWRVIGSLVHNCLAYHYGTMMNPRPLFLDEYPLHEQLVMTAGAHQDLVSVAYEVFEAYKKTYAGEAWIPRFVEEEFGATIGELDPGGPHPELDAERITCRSDLIIESNGEYWAVDYKCSAGTFNQERLEPWKDDGEYRMHWQAIVNLHILRKRLDKPVRGFIIQRIKRKAPYDFDRRALKIPVLAYQTAPRSMRMFVKRENELLARLRAGEKPVPNYACCQGRYGACDYINLCGADSEAMRDLVFDQEFVQIRKQQ